MKSRGKEKSEGLPCEQSLQGFEISRAFHLRNRWDRKAVEISNPVKIAHKAILLIFVSSNSSFHFTADLYFIWTILNNCTTPEHWNSILMRTKSNIWLLSKLKTKEYTYLEFQTPKNIEKCYQILNQYIWKNLILKNF